MFNNFNREFNPGTSHFLVSEPIFMVHEQAQGELFNAACEGRVLNLFPIYFGAFDPGEILDFETVLEVLGSRKDASWRPGTN